MQEFSQFSQIVVPTKNIVDKEIAIIQEIDGKWSAHDNMQPIAERELILV
jgi:hypothetical protein